MRWLAAIATFGLLGLTFLSFVLRNRDLVASGGHSWTHGEWLISLAAGPVRRGVSGSAILSFSDVTGIPPLVLVEGAQAIALAALIGTLIWALWRIGPQERILICLVSPAFFLFWHNEFGSHGKEILACSPYLPLILAAGGRTSVAPARIACLVLLAVAATAHETAILHVPALCLASWALAPGRAGLVFVGAAGLVAFSVVGIILALGPVDDAGLLCDAIMQRGVSPSVCGAPFDWAAIDTAQALAFTLERLPERDWVGILATFLLAYIPLIIALRHSPHRRMWHALLILNFLAYLPLYAVAIDYGRWLNMQVSGITLAILVAALSGWDRGLKVPLARWAFGTFLALALIWRVSMVSGGIGSGILEPVVKAALGVN